MHDWHVRQVAVDGAIATVPLCRRCPAIDVENVTVEGWNREERRRAARQVARRLIDGHAR